MPRGPRSRPAHPAQTRAFEGKNRQRPRVCSIHSHKSVASLTTAWEIAQALGLCAVAGCLILCMLAVRPRAGAAGAFPVRGHELLGWLALAAAVLHVGLLLGVDHRVVEHVKLTAPRYEYAGILALVDQQRGSAPTMLIGLGVGNLLKKEGISSYSELDWDQSVTVKDTKFLFLEAIHTSRRGMWDTNETLWGSFLIDSPEGRIYFAGDTAYGKHFKHLYEKYGAPKLSLLPVGAYEPRWFMYRLHMNPDEAVLAHIDLHSERSIAIHLGLIDNAAEGYKAPVNDLALARNVHGIAEVNFVAPRIGQIFQY